MRKHPVLDAMIDAVLAGPPDEEAVLARCHESVAHIPPLIVDTLRLLTRRVALERATHDDVEAALERTFFECAVVRDALEGHEWDEDDEPYEPCSLNAYLRDGSKYPRVRRWFLAPARPSVMRGGMPPVTTVAELASLLEIEVDALDALTLPRRSAGVCTSHDHYFRSWVPKRRGGARLLERPKTRLRTAQRRLLDVVLHTLPVHDAAHGFVRGRSPMSHAGLHAGKDVVLSFDLEEFFPSVSKARVAGILRACGYSHDVAESMSRLTTTPTPASLLPTSHAHDARIRYRDPHLPQGAPSSPALANAAARMLDSRLAGLAACLDLTYSRYADDLVFSGASPLARRARYVEARVNEIVLDEGFRLNHAKSRCVRSSQQQIVTGLVVNDVPAVSRVERKRLEATLMRCVRHGPGGENRANVPDFRAHLAGRVAYVSHVRPAHGETLEALLDQIRW